MKDSHWFVEPIGPGTFQLHPIKEVIFSGRTAFQKVEIVEIEGYGRCLLLDGRTQSTELDEGIYHEALVHPALVMHPYPRRIFIAGGGEGATAREALAYKTVAEVVMVDIDREVVELARKHLPSLHRGAFADPRLKLHHEDARSFLARSEGGFDAIILDLTDPMEGGPSVPLFTRESFLLAREKLAPQGLLVLQTGPASLGNCTTFTVLAHTLESVFPCVSPYRAHVPSFGGAWGLCLASAKWDPLSFSPEGIDRLLALKLSRPLRFYDGLTHQGLFSLPKDLREALAGETRVATEKEPIYAP